MFRDNIFLVVLIAHIVWNIRKKVNVGIGDEANQVHWFLLGSHIWWQRLFDDYVKCSSGKMTVSNWVSSLVKNRVHVEFLNKIEVDKLGVFGLWLFTALFGSGTSLFWRGLHLGYCRKCGTLLRFWVLTISYRFCWLYLFGNPGRLLRRLINRFRRSQGSLTSSSSHLVK